MVTDGNHKCYRLRCLSDNNFINFNDKLQLGCDNIPQRGSYFCENHNLSENVNSYMLDDE